MHSHRAVSPTTTPRGAGRALVALLALLLVAGFAGGQQGDPVALDDPNAVLDAIYDNLRGGGQAATLRMVVERSDDTREYLLETVSDGAERSLTRVLEPSRDAGQAFLVDGDELFVYSPRLGRALRLPASGRSDGFLGSDLSYDDLAGDEMRDDFDVSVAEHDADVVVLSLIPRPTAPTPYGELRFTATLPDLVPQELVYFDQRGEAVKRLLLDEVEETGDGRSVPTRFEMIDLTDDGGRTVAEWTDAEYGVDPPDACFTQQALERGCTW